MNFVNRLRRTQGIAPGALRHPILIGPLIVKIPNHRRGTRRLFTPDADRVSFIDAVSVAPGLDVKFVERASGYARNKTLPNAGVSARLKRIRLELPVIEVADDGHLAGIRSPHTENCPSFALARDEMRTHGLVKTIVAAFVEQVEILIGEQGSAIRSEAGLVGHVELLVYRKSPARDLSAVRLWKRRAILSFPAMPALRLIFLWHQHQPFYKDLVTGEYRLPWVRLRALKDYYGMVKLLDEFPKVQQNFNLVPSLMTQIQDYGAGTAQDPFLQVAAKPAKELTPNERQFALQYLFQANPTNVIGRYPRYWELREKFREHGYNAEKAEKYFEAQQFTDLQVLSQMAWFDEFFLEDKDVNGLIKKERNYSLEDQRFVIERERELLGKVLPAYADAAKKGSIEISATPFYHPILPLACDTNAGAASSPGLPLPQNRFRHPEDAREQLVRALDLHEKVFGIRPRGVWPSEGSVSEEVLGIAHNLGVKWMATDEGVLGRSLGTFFSRDGEGRLPAAQAEKLYTIHRFENAQTAMHLIFRDHTISDLVGFVYSGMPADQAAQHLIHNIRRAAQPVLDQGRDAIMPIILDGENAWEYYPRSGREFLRRFYDALAREPGIEAV